MTAQKTGRAPVKSDGGDIAEQVARQEAADAQYNIAEQRVIAQKNWIARLLPPPERGGLSAEAFCVQVLSLLRRSAKRSGMTLMSAACENPDSLVFAMTDCAARNLIPGEEYWFVPFRDTQGGGPPVVTGMPGWKGELQQIYRSGMVEAVVCELVYEGDRFRWLPTKMRVPEHEPRDVPHDAQFIRRGYAYAHLRGGGTTYPVVLGTHEVEIIESHSKAPRDFWQNPKWRDRMWRKSLLHMLYDRVPHSAAYNTALVEAFAEAEQRFPALSLSGSDDGSDLTAGPDGALAAAGVQVPAAVQGRAERPAPPPVPGNDRRHREPAGEQPRNSRGRYAARPDDRTEEEWPGDARPAEAAGVVVEDPPPDLPGEGGLPMAAPGFQWQPPPDIDPEVVGLCQAMNAFPGISTVESCCGHGRGPFRIWFTAGSLDALPPVLYWFDRCHSGERGWRVTVSTDCGAGPPVFRVEGPCGGYAAAEVIAKRMREDLDRLGGPG